MGKSEDFEQRYLGLALERVMGGRHGCDVQDAVLSRLAHPPVVQKSQGLPRLIRWNHVAAGLAAACLVAGVLLMLSTPARVAEPMVTVLHSDGVRNSFIAARGRIEEENSGLRLNAAWALLSYPQKALAYAGVSIHGDKGRAMVVAGEIPDEASLAIMVDELAQAHGDQPQGQKHMALSDKEQETLMNRRSWQRMNGVAVCMFAGALSINGMRVEAEEQAKGNTIEVVEDKTFEKLTGADSQITEARCVLVRTLADFDALWQEHSSQAWDASKNKPDFNTHMVLAVFGGMRHDAAVDVRLHGLFTSLPDELNNAASYHVVRVGYVSPQKEKESEPEQSLASTPYGFFALPKSDLAVRVELWDEAKMGATFSALNHFPAIGNSAAPDTALAGVEAQGYQKSLKSSIDQDQAHIAVNQKTLEAVLKWHDPNPANGRPIMNAAGFDFSKEFVVAVFAGKTTQMMEVCKEDVLVDAASRRIIVRVRDGIFPYKPNPGESFTPATFFTFSRKDGIAGWSIAVEKRIDLPTDASNSRDRDLSYARIAEILIAEEAKGK